MADSKEMMEISGSYAPEESASSGGADLSEIRPDADPGLYGGMPGAPLNPAAAAQPAEAAGAPVIDQVSEPVSEPAYGQAPVSSPSPVPEQIPNNTAPGASSVSIPKPETAYVNTPGNTGDASAKASDTKKKFSLREWVPGPNVPNNLTIARIFMIPLYVIFALWVPKPAGDVLAVIVFIIASLTDTADGYIARRYNYVTTFGKFMDPLADKLLVCSAMICLVDLGRIDSWVVIIIIAREFIISGFRLVSVEKGVVIAANIWGKVKTVIQMLMVILMTANFQGFLGTLAQVFMWFALALTIISLATYLLQNRHVLQDNK